MKMRKLTVGKYKLFLFLFLISVSFVSAQKKPDALQKYRDDDFQAAADICLEELKTSPNNMNSYTVLGWSLVKLKKYQEALDCGFAALKISRYDMRIVENIAEAYYFTGDNAKALRYFEEYAAEAPSGGRIDTVYYYMGEIFIRLGEYNNADISLTTALYHSPNIAKWWGRLGYAREMAGDYRSSLNAYEKSLQINPFYTEASRGKTRVQNKLNS